MPKFIEITDPNKIIQKNHYYWDDWAGCWNPLCKSMKDNWAEKRNLASLRGYRFAEIREDKPIQLFPCNKPFPWGF